MGIRKKTFTNTEEKKALLRLRDENIAWQLLKKINSALKSHQRNLREHQRIYQDKYEFLKPTKMDLWAEIYFLARLEDLLVTQRRCWIRTSAHPLAGRKHMCYSHQSFGKVSYDPSTHIHVVLRWRGPSTDVICIPYNSPNARLHKILKCPSGKYEPFQY